MSVKANDVITMDATGLLRPKSGSRMMLGDNSIVEVPDDYFVHPQTGHVLPIQGNVAFDPVTSRLVFVVDAATGRFIYDNFDQSQQQKHYFSSMTC